MFPEQCLFLSLHFWKCSGSSIILLRLCGGMQAVKITVVQQKLSRAFGFMASASPVRQSCCMQSRCSSISNQPTKLCWKRLLTVLICLNTEGRNCSSSDWERKNIKKWVTKPCKMERVHRACVPIAAPSMQGGIRWHWQMTCSKWAGSRRYFSVPCLCRFWSTMPQALKGNNFQILSETHL